MNTDYVIVHRAHTLTPLAYDNGGEIEDVGVKYDRTTPFRRHIFF